MSKLSFDCTNTVLYCRHWEKTVAFYKNKLELVVTHENDWFIEFQITKSSFISIANEKRATIQSSSGEGITITFHVDNITETWEHLRRNGVVTEEIAKHPWGGQSFFLYDPEGHRLEVWTKTQ